MQEKMVTMSIKELSRLKVLEKLAGKRLTQLEAAMQMRLSDRQVRRLQKKYSQQGVVGLASCHRGKPGNNRLSEEVKREAMEIIGRQYKDFGPTLAHEKLTEVHGLKLSVESVRQLMMREEFWKGKKRKKMIVHQQRARRSSVGELIQIDGSAHDWFEGRGDRCCLLVWIDDATSRLQHLHFEKSETTRGYFAGMKDYFKKHGKPVCLYSDRHGIFRQNQGSDLKELDDPQFSRALKELDIDLICANSPQAKGRVERANGILQDRLVKEMRLRQINDMPSANAFLPVFIADYNKRFAVLPKNPQDSHQPVLQTEAALDLILSHQEERQLSRNLEISYHNVIYQIQGEQKGYRLRGSTVLVSENLEGVVTLWRERKSLSYTTITRQQRRTDIVDSKEKDNRVDEAVKARKISTYKPSWNHPWKGQCPAAIAAENAAQERRRALGG